MANDKYSNFTAVLGTVMYLNNTELIMSKRKMGK